MTRQQRIDRARAMRADGSTYKEIAAHLGDVSHWTVKDWCKGVKVGAKEEKPDEVGVPIDTREMDGETRIVADKPLSVEEMAALFKVDLSEWTAKNIRTNKWQGFYRLPGGTGHKKVDLFQTRVTWERNVKEVVKAAILEFVEKSIPAAKRRPAAPYEPTDDPQLLVCGLWDAHIGLYCWSEETGDDYDIDMARRRVMNAVDDIVREVSGFDIQRAIMPIGNDLMHVDSVRNTTTFGTHFLDTDTRYAKMFLTALECQEYFIERLLDVVPRVEGLYVPGNHDTTSSFTLCAALNRRFRDEPRVSIDLSMNPRKYVEHGGVLLGFDHGADCKPNQLAMIMASECRDKWTGKTYREIQVGHTHQRRERQYDPVIPTNGVLVRTNPALCGVDAWHHRQGLIGEPMKSVEVYRYDKIGFRGSHVTWARDD